MQAGSIVDDTLKDVQRFRILCVGRSGVGKSSLINRVFRLENSLNAAHPVQWTPGHADIDKGFTSPENNYIVLHDSKGFELANTEASNDVDRFIRQRCDSNLPLKDQLHAVWLCAETPRAGGRIFEKGDESLLRLVRDTGTPVVVVFTKYDRLVKTKRVELQEDDDSLSGDVLRERSKEEARKVLDVCIQSLERTLRDMDTRESQMLKPHHVNVSNQPGYEDSISTLAQVTCELVSDKLKLMWAIAQRASREVKISACVDIAMGYYKILPDSSGSSVRPMPLRDCLGRVHQDIITCWNFRDEEKSLSSDQFKALMLYLVQDVQASQDQNGPHVTPPLAIDKISTFVSPKPAPATHIRPVIDLTSSFEVWLSNAVMDDGPPARRLLMAYTADLITVLKSVFDVETPSLSEGTMWFELNRVFQTYQLFDPREQIHRRICANFEHDRQTSDPTGFRRELHELMEREPPLSSSESKVTGGRNAQDPRDFPKLLPGAGMQLRGVSVSSPGVHATPIPVAGRPPRTSTISPPPTSFVLTTSPHQLPQDPPPPRFRATRQRPAAGRAASVEGPRRVGGIWAIICACLAAPRYAP